MPLDHAYYQEITEEVITFWFDAPDSAELGANRSIWFDSNPAFKHLLNVVGVFELLECTFPLFHWWNICIEIFNL